MSIPPHQGPGGPERSVGPDPEPEDRAPSGRPAPQPEDRAPSGPPAPQPEDRAPSARLVRQPEDRLALGECAERPGDRGPAPGDGGSTGKGYKGDEIAGILILAVWGVAAAILMIVTAGRGSTDASDQGYERPVRGGVGTADLPDPVIADWRVLAHDGREIAYDVPPDWEVASSGTLAIWDVDQDDGEDPARYALTAPATYLDGHCGPDTERAIVGTTGARGAESSEHASNHNAQNYVTALFDPDLEGEREDIPAEPFKNDQGFTGYLAVSEAGEYPFDEEDPCADPAGTVYAVSWVTLDGDIMSWVLALTTGIEEELEQETVDQILDSLRFHTP